MSTGQTERITLSVNGETFVALSHGEPSAPVVLCIHGFPDHARSFDRLAPLLVQAGYRCVAPWLRGYAPSVLEGPFHIDQIAADIVGLAHAISPARPVTLIGHDWGAVASYLALARSQQTFAHAVTMAVPHPIALSRNLKHHPAQLRLSWYMGFFQLRGVSDAIVKRDKLAFIDRLWRDWSPGYQAPLEYMGDLKRCLSVSLPAPLGYYRALFSLRPEAVARQRAGLKATRSITVPTLYLHGEQDGCMLYAIGEGQARHFTRGFASECLDDVGHFLHLEAPERVAEKILAFLRATPG